MRDVWSEKNKFSLWFDIEAGVCEALAEAKVIPAEAAKEIRTKGAAAIKAFSEADHDRILEIESETKHDVIAYLTWLGEKIGPSSRFVHQGLTSSDMLDTALSLQLKQASDILLADLDLVLDALYEKAQKYKLTPTIGRSHGIHAEPTTFGLKMAGFYAEFNRAKERLLRAREEISICALSGPVGTFAYIHPEIEEKVAKRLGLVPESISTQVIPRDRHATFLCVLAVIASSMERVAVEIRHLQRTEVGEAAESFSKAQKGSSAMPHKRNPVLSENLTGLARLIRSYAYPAMENVALWHERDISHSSVERNICPDATEALDFSLVRLATVLKNLHVDEEKMRANLDSTLGLHESGAALIGLTHAGISREDAYKAVQASAMETWDGLKSGSPKTFRENLLKNEKISKSFTPEELEALLGQERHTQHVDRIYSRVFKDRT